ncbi:hypothetical protein ACFLYP_01275 [Chloroflexota bacterium]
MTLPSSFADPTFRIYLTLIQYPILRARIRARMREEFPQVCEEYLTGKFPPDIEQKLQNILLKIGNQLIIVCPSSLLEDNFGTSW